MNLNPDYLNMTVSAGATVGGCLREAMIRALTDKIEVRFLHNGKQFAISPEKMIDGQPGYTIDGQRADQVYADTRG